MEAAPSGSEAQSAEESQAIHVVRQLGPGVYELSTGDFAVIGTDVTTALDPALPAMDAARAPYERTVTLPREALLAARDSIPDA